MTRPNIVGAIHTVGGFRHAAGAFLDLAEVRIDLLPADLSPMRVEGLSVPVLLTVRRPDEGAGRSYSDEDRRRLYERFLPCAAAVDVELRSLPALDQVLRRARKGRQLVVLSYHDFGGAPSLRKLRGLAKAARERGADIVKIAVMTERPGEVARLLELLEESTAPIALMGMGALGRSSRLVLAKAGSVLNYGWLDRPQVPGQWGAKEFYQLLARG